MPSFFQRLLGAAPLPEARFATAAPAVSNEAQNYSNLSAAELVRLGIFGGDLASYAGIPVTDQSAMLVGTVYACLSRLSGAVSQLPVHQYRIKADGERERVPATPLWWMLNESPDDRWTAASWKEWIVRCVALRGDQHTQILRKGPAVDGLKVLHPDHVQARRVGNRLRYDCFDPETGEVYGVDQDDMLHFPGFGFDGVSSMSAIKWAARNAVSNVLATSRYIGKTVGEGAMPQITLQYPNKLSPDQGETVRQAFHRIYGGGEGRKFPLVLTEGATAQPLNISPVDLELLATRKLEKSDICEVLGVPPILIGDSEKTSSWGTGVEQITIAWVRYSINPMLARWEEELNRKLFRRAGQFVEFELAGLLRGDSKAQAEAFRAALGGPGTGDGWMTVNEIRRLLNLPRIDDPEADKPFRAQRGTTAKPSDPGAPAP